MKLMMHFNLPWSTPLQKGNVAHKAHMRHHNPDNIIIIIIIKRSLIE